MLQGSSEFVEEFSKFFTDYQAEIQQLQEQQTTRLPTDDKPVENILFPSRIKKLVEQVYSLETKTTGPLSLHELIKSADPFLGILETILEKLRHEANLFDSHPTLSIIVYRQFLLVLTLYQIRNLTKMKHHITHRFSLRGKHVLHFMKRVSIIPSLSIYLYIYNVLLSIQHF